MPGRPSSLYRCGMLKVLRTSGCRSIAAETACARERRRSSGSLGTIGGRRWRGVAFGGVAQRRRWIEGSGRARKRAGQRHGAGVGARARGGGRRAGAWLIIEEKAHAQGEARFIAFLVGFVFVAIAAGVEHNIRASARRTRCAKSHRMVSVPVSLRRGRRLGRRSVALGCIRGAILRP